MKISSLSFLMAFAFCVFSRKSLPSQKLQGYSSLWYSVHSHSWSISSWFFLSGIEFEVLPLYVVSRLFQHNMLKRYLYFHWIAFMTLLNITWPSVSGPYAVLLPHGLEYCSFIKSLETCRVVSQFYYCFPRLDYSFPLQIHFKIISVISKKEVWWDILTRIALHLSIYWRGWDTFLWTRHVVLIFLSNFVILRSIAGTEILD